MGRILICHTDKSVQEKLRDIIEDQGHWTLCESSPLQSEHRINTHHPDVFIVSISALGDSARNSVQTFKSLSRNHSLSIVFLSPPGTMTETTELLSQTKAHGILSDEDFNEEEIHSTIQNLLSNPSTKKIAKRFLSYGHMELDRDSRTVRLGAALVSDLPQKPFDLLWLITKRSPEISRREFLISKLWDTQVRDREVDVLISRLKSKVPFISDFFSTIPGKGYRLSPPTLTKKRPPHRK